MYLCSRAHCFTRSWASFRLLVSVITHDYPPPSPLVLLTSLPTHCTLISSMQLGQPAPAPLPLSETPSLHIQDPYIHSVSKRLSTEIHAGIVKFGIIEVQVRSWGMMCEGRRAGEGWHGDRGQAGGDRGTVSRLLMDTTLPPTLAAAASSFSHIFPLTSVLPHRPPRSLASRCTRTRWMAWATT